VLQTLKGTLVYEQRAVEYRGWADMKRRRSKEPKPRAEGVDTPSDGAGRRSGLAWTAGLLLASMTVVAYLPVTECGYIWDDDSYVQDNQTLRSMDGLRQIWFEIGATKQYYPMVHTSYWLEYRLWQLNSSGYHIVNILLHALGAVLLWRILALLKVPGAWIASAVFALHPVHVESVAWITERKNVLSGVFYLAATLAYFRYALPRGGAQPHGQSGRLYGAALVFFLCALLSKTVTCTLPAALLLVLWWKGKRVRWVDVGRLLPFVILGAALGFFTIWMEKHEVGAVGEEWHLTIIDRCLIAGRALCFYVTKLLWPSPLVFIYPRWEIDAGLWWQYLYPAAAIVVLISLWLARHRIGKGPVVAALFFAGTLLPALGFFDVYPMRFSFVADHFQYLASIGVIALLTALGYRVAAKQGNRGKGIATVICALVLGTLGTLTWRQGDAYMDGETLWLDTLRKNPDVWLAHNNLGNLCERRGKLDQAIHHHSLALRARPQFDSNMADSHYNLGNALAAQGRFDAAIQHYQQALKISPNLVGAHNNLGSALLKMGRIDEAVQQYRQALQIKPDFAGAHENLISVLMMQGKVDEAVTHLRQVVQIQPDDAWAHNRLAQTLLTIGRDDDALKHFREAVRLKPDWPVPLVNLAWLLATHPDPGIRDASEAVRLAERAAVVTGHRDPGVLDALAAAYAAAGRFEPAIATARRAIGLAQASDLAERIRSRLQLYERGEPYRRPTPTHRATDP